jgi:D-alanyl-lipoteichoic acid acyltransferase DltB (MBOAT superfamily)
MLFPTFEFFIFFTLVLILNWALKRWPLVWRLFLLAASYYFYSIWDNQFLLILFIVSVVNFLSGISIHNNYFKGKKIYLSLVVIFNILILGVFKYYDFFRVSAETLLEKAGFLVSLPFLEIILPIGLSFYIFRAISYNADVYSKKINACKNPLDFFIYVAFFPQLLAGPIMRAGNFLGQLKDGGAKKIEGFYENLTLIILGLFKKLAISSYLALAITDDVFAVPENHSSLILLTAIFAYSLVIYFDFSGYSDMAIGFAGMMGFKSPVNFYFPYLSLNLKDFWRRWHMTLSSWVKDYIYIPLGGNRRGELRKYFNLMMAMLAIGLWHGAAAHFIAWGAIHGLGLVMTHFFLGAKKETTNLLVEPRKTIFKKIKNITGNFISWFFTFIFISFAWIFFRSETLNEALIFLKTLFSFERIVEPFKLYAFFLTIFGTIFFLLEKQITSGLIFLQKKLPFLLLILFIICFIILTLKLSPDTLPSFIYFNF